MTTKERLKYDPPIWLKALIGVLVIAAVGWAFGDGDKLAQFMQR